MRLLGPAPFDLAAPAQSARVAVASYAAGTDVAGIGQMAESDGSDPGLYFLEDDQERLIGFWLVFGERWLDDGVGPGRIPPYAEDLLEACTEEIWWERMKVAPIQRGRWRPLVVLEWPKVLAERCALPPPGVRPPEPSEPELEEVWQEEPDTTWIEPVVQPPPGFDEPERIPTAKLRWGALPENRSVLAVLVGDLGRRAGIHEGRYALAGVPYPNAMMPEGIPLEAWIENVGRVAPPEEHEMMHPVQLFGDRAGFPITGWLSRDLEITPSDPTDVLPGSLVARDIHSRFWGQMALAAFITLSVMLGVLGFSGGVHFAAMPRLEVAASVPPAASQPAMSVCSADHRRFVEAFRCQIRHLSEGGRPGEARCETDPGEDLQPQYCGLVDRALDGWDAESGDAFGELAAAAACFEVLGEPYPYAKRDSGGEVPDPARLLHDEQLKVSALVDLFAELDLACDAYREKMEARVAGAVLATHVGDRSDEGTQLADLAFGHATMGASSTEVACYRAGREERVASGETLAGLCGPDPGDATFSDMKSWASLGGAPAAPAIERYTAARYGTAGTARGLWECHLELEMGVQTGSVPGLWDFSLPRPKSYAGRGVRSQLQLDAGLTAIREVGTSDPCWSEIQRMFGSYEPVHPLLEAPEEGGWPSVEQQVCAQTCAAGYRVAEGPRKWVTPGTDIGMCTTGAAPPTNASAAGGDNRLDRLRLPWNAGPDGEWIEPSASQVCAFNLIAQGRLEGATGDLAPPLWAGELASGSGIAGGDGGAAVRAAEALGTYGRNRSSSTCGYVAVQCFTGELMNVLADGRFEVYQWRDEWRRRVRDLPLRRQDEVAPWCRLIRPYIREDGTLPEGEFNYPCALGVDQARQRIEASIQGIASGSFGEDG